MSHIRLEEPSGSKLYGALLNEEEEADTFFDQQAHVIEELKGFENTEKTVAYFYVSTDGSIVVRNLTIIFRQ